MRQFDRETMHGVDVIIRPRGGGGPMRAVGQDVVFVLENVHCHIERVQEFLDHHVTGSPVPEQVIVNERVTVTLTSGAIREATEEEAEGADEILGSDTSKVRKIRL